MNDSVQSAPLFVVPYVEPQTPSTSILGVYGDLPDKYWSTHPVKLLPPALSR